MVRSNGIIVFPPLRQARTVNLLPRAEQNGASHGGNDMKKPIILLTVTVNVTVLLVFLSRENPSSSSPRPRTATNSSSSMARSFILWLHGLGDSGPANEPIKTLFTSPEFRATKWSFPSAPSNPVTCNCKLFYDSIGSACNVFDLLDSISV